MMFYSGTIWCLVRQIYKVEIVFSVTWVTMEINTRLADLVYYRRFEIVLWFKKILNL